MAYQTEQVTKRSITAMGRAWNGAAEVTVHFEDDKIDLGGGHIILCGADLLALYDDWLASQHKPAPKINGFM